MWAGSLTASVHEAGFANNQEQFAVLYASLLDVEFLDQDLIKLIRSDFLRIRQETVGA